MIAIGDFFRVMKLSGPLAKYVTKPGKVGKVLKIMGDKILGRFPYKLGGSLYYYHDHWFYIGDVKVVKLRKLIPEDLLERRG